MAEFQYLNGGNSEVQDKQAEAYLFAPSGTVGVAASGVIEGLGVTQTGTASGSVLIGPGACLVQGSLGQGADRLINDTAKTLDVFTANPVGGLPRRDIVVFDSVTSAITVIIGTPNASPTDPTVPATAVALARLRHVASDAAIATADIDDLRVYTALRGVMLPAVSVKSTTGSATISTAEVTVLNAPAVLGDGVRRFKITASFHTMSGPVSGDVTDFHIVDSTTSTTLATHRKTLFTTAIGIRADGMTMSVTDVPSAGSHVYRLSGIRSAGTGNPNIVVASATAPIEIVVEQIA